MSSLIIAGDSSGAITLAAPAVAGTNTITIAAQTGTLNVAGPAFSAYASTTQSISSATFTKVTFGAEDYDTNSNFASSTFTPTVAGYYQINVTGSYGGSGNPTREIIALYKNGSVLQRLVDSSANVNILSASTQVYMNGSTDYLEVYAYMTSTGTIVISSTTVSETFRISGCLVRSA
jgi:hypothetical protein